MILQVPPPPRISSAQTTVSSNLCETFNLCMLDLAIKSQKIIFNSEKDFNNKWFFFGLPVTLLKDLEKKVGVIALLKGFIVYIEGLENT